MTVRNDERKLLLRMAAGDERAFTTLYEDYRHQVETFIIKYVKSPFLADDLTQEVFLSLWESRSTLTDIQSFRAYLFVMARNNVLNVLKKASRIDTAKAEILRHYLAVQETSIDHLAWKEYQQYIRDTLEGLPTQTRVIFHLLREEGRSYDEVAALLGISRNAVKKHIVRIHKAFRDTLGSKGASLLLLLYIEQVLRDL